MARARSWPRAAAFLASDSSPVPEGRAHRRLHFFDVRPGPARERLRLSHDCKQARHVQLHRRGPGPDHLVKAARPCAAAGREVHVAVGTDLEIADWHRLAVNELREILTPLV